MTRIEFRSAPRRRPGPKMLAGTILGAMLLPAPGCGQRGESVETPASSAGEGAGLSLPPGFKVVDLPLETRKQIFNEVHDIRSLAVQEANHKLPMDEDSLPKNDVPAFDKRVAEHKAILTGIERKNIAALAEKYKIGVADVEKIEEEASRLRWIPPQEPVFEPGSSPGGDPPAAKGGQGDAGTKAPSGA